MHQSNGLVGKPTGTLTAPEKAALISQIESTIKTMKIFFVLACLSVVIIVGIFAAPAIYVAWRKEQRKLAEIQQADPKVYEATGILTRKTAGAKGNWHVYFIDGQLLPGEVITRADKSGIEDRLGQTVTFQYVPSISKNRLYRDQKGHGYNFITKSAIDS